MGRGRKGLKAVIDEMMQGADRSPLFWWLVEHHDELLTASSGRRLQWGPLCQRFEALGLTDRTGKPASESVARKTWLRARTMVVKARVALAAAPPKRLMPSRLPKDWRPEVVSTRDLSAEPVRSQTVASVTPQSVAPFESGRTYEMPYVADEDLDLSEIPETFEDLDGQIKPRPLEARRVLARIKLELRWDGRRLSRIMNG